jgi:hypothetical protein
MTNATRYGLRMMEELIAQAREILQDTGMEYNQPQQWDD